MGGAASEDSEVRGVQAARFPALIGATLGGARHSESDVCGASGFVHGGAAGEDTEVGEVQPAQFLV